MPAQVLTKIIRGSKAKSLTNFTPALPINISRKENSSLLVTNLLARASTKEIGNTSDDHNLMVVGFDKKK